MVRYRSSSKTVYSAKYHVIWWAKYRKRTLLGDVAARLRAMVVEMVGEFGGEVIELEVIADHVHLLVELPPATARSLLMQLLKGRSSRRLGHKFPHLAPMRCLWSPSWFEFTASGAPPDVVCRHVENQKQAA